MTFRTINTHSGEKVTSNTLFKDSSTSLEKKTSSAMRAILSPVENQEPKTPTSNKRDRDWKDLTPKSPDNSSSSPRTPVDAKKRQLYSNSDLGSPQTSKQETTTASSDWGFESPRSPSALAHRVCVLPPTPGKKNKKKQSNIKSSDAISAPTNTPALAAKSFGTMLSFANDPNSINPITFLSNKTTLKGQLFKHPSGKIVAAIQQPIQDKPTCGPGCALMIGLKNINKLAESQDFWDWYSTTRASNGDSLLVAFEHLEIPAKVCKMTDVSISQSPDSEDAYFERQLLKPNEVINHIKETITKTKESVILEISHPNLKGHWIVVDGFHEGCALIRDPYTGLAFALPEETLSLWLKKLPVNEMIYFPSV